jgi:hypothetical protein
MQEEVRAWVRSGATPYSWSTGTWPLGWWIRRGCGICRVSTMREDVLHELHPLGCHADRLLMGLALRVVHHRTTHRSHPRDVSQFHQPFPFERALDAFRHAFVEPQGVN